MKRICATCLRRIENEDAPVLTMGAYGNPKVLCDECAELIDKMTLSREYEEITEAINAIADKMSASNVDDRVTVETMTAMLENSAKRAQQIKDGTYDFALDEQDSDEGFDEIPEELRETEEDRLLDEKEAEANAKFDKFLNWAWVGVAVAVVGFIIYRIFG